MKLTKLKMFKQGPQDTLEMLEEKVNEFLGNLEEGQFKDVTFRIDPYGVTLVVLYLVEK